MLQTPPISLPPPGKKTNIDGRKNLGLKKKRYELGAMHLLGMPSLPDIKNEQITTLQYTNMAGKSI